VVCALERISNWNGKVNIHAAHAGIPETLPIVKGRNRRWCRQGHTEHIYRSTDETTKHMLLLWCVCHEFTLELFMMHTVCLWLWGKPPFTLAS
jgi:hypothetical protein